MFEIEGWAGFKLARKLKQLKLNIKDWTKDHFRDVERMKATILEDIHCLDSKEVVGQLCEEEVSNRLSLKEEFLRKVREEEIKWRQRSRCKWLKKGHGNTKFFHGMAAAGQRGNRIASLMDTL